MIRKNTILSIIAGFLVLHFIFASCNIKKKSISKRIEGTWEIINIMDPNDPLKEQWRFENDGDVNYIYRISIDNNISTVMDTGQYSIESKVFVSYVNIAYMEASYALDGKWEIAKLKKDVMILIQRPDKGGGYMYKEFQSVD